MPSTQQQIAQLEGQIQAQEQMIQTLEQKLAELEQKIKALTSPILHTYETFGDPIKQPALDSSVIWMRGKQESTPPKYAHQILSLISEVSAEQSFPWPLYIQLKTSHDKGDGAGATVRLVRDGDGWSVGYHAETFHNAGDGSTIGVNIEAHKKTNTGRSIGLNIQAVGWQWSMKDEYGEPIDTTVDDAINIQTHSKAVLDTGLHFDKESTGTRAVWIQGNWDVGIDTGDTCIRMNKGAELCFDETRRFYMKYNPEKDRIEFHNRTSPADDKVIGYIPSHAPEHEL